jgi:DNA-3-methyladenine glycosylase II
MSAAPPLDDAFHRARRHLSRRDPVLRRLIATVGPCTLRPEPDGFHSLVRAIIAQMISTKAAHSIFAKLKASLGRKKLTPAAILALDEAALRGVGLSGTKARGLLDLAGRVRSGALPLARFPQLSDDEVIEHLVAVRGIGRWTAEMFLIFSLGRLDVWAVDDFGLRAGVQAHFGLDGLPDRATMRAVAEPWRPYRSVASWYLWRWRDVPPQPKTSVGRPRRGGTSDESGG